jgi:hypothetical protein
MDAPEGYEWKYVKLPREKRCDADSWKEIIFLTADMHQGTVAVLVPIGQPGTKTLDKRRANRIR